MKKTLWTNRPPPRLLEPMMPSLPKDLWKDCGVLPAIKRSKAFRPCLQTTTLSGKNCLQEILSTDFRNQDKAFLKCSRQSRRQGNSLTLSWQKNLRCSHTRQLPRRTQLLAWLMPPLLNRMEEDMGCKEWVSRRDHTRSYPLWIRLNHSRLRPWHCPKSLEIPQEEPASRKNDEYFAL